MAPGTKARILVVDDEALIANTLAVIFRNAGYDVQAAHSAESALALMERWDWAPDVALIDVLLPGMNGIDLAITLGAKIPGVRLLLFSGQASTSDLVEAASKRGHAFDVLAKPVHPAELLNRISSLVPNPPGA